MGRRTTWVLNCVGVPHELVRDIVMIGRVPSNHIVIDDPTVSAQHALLLRVGASYWLKDLNSTNGTYINGVLVTDAELKDGDTIQLGSVVVAFAGGCRKRWPTFAIRKSSVSFKTRPKFGWRYNFAEKRKFSWRAAQK
jgi:pSer/pThr/pTyr-binding forkhead associated (FHA) protein